jgi:hypothetical protein
MGVIKMERYESALAKFAAKLSYASLELNSPSRVGALTPTTTAQTYFVHLSVSLPKIKARGETFNRYLVMLDTAPNKVYVLPKVATAYTESTLPAPMFEVFTLLPDGIIPLSSEGITWDNEALLRQGIDSKSLYTALTGNYDVFQLVSQGYLTLGVLKDTLTTVKTVADVKSQARELAKEFGVTPIMLRAIGETQLAATVADTSQGYKLDDTVPTVAVDDVQYPDNDGNLKPGEAVIDTPVETVV